MKKKQKKVARRATKLELTLENFWFLKRTAAARSKSQGRFVSMTSVINELLAKAAGRKK